MADQVRQYALGELMSDEDSLMHYGVLGMKWGKSRAKASGNDIRVARQNVRKQQENLADQVYRVNQATKRGDTKGAVKAYKKLNEMNAALLKDPDRVIASRMTRGEKVVYTALTGPVGLALIGATSATSRRIERKQETGAYDN